MLQVLKYAAIFGEILKAVKAFKRGEKVHEVLKTRIDGVRVRIVIDLLKENE